MADEIQRSVAENVADAAAPEPPACTTTWVGASSGGNWADEANWSGGLPEAEDTVCIHAEDVSIGEHTIVVAAGIVADTHLASIHRWGGLLSWRRNAEMPL
ncbi:MULTISPECIES: hypothetical protein [unclassified Microbacterium]|uniref:hypothetical protein n=1 Tax=unclassified Microbacterium TaxID=2609290 RepID=UPI0030179363